MIKNFLLLIPILVTISSIASVQAQEPQRPNTGTFVKDQVRDGYGELTIINDNSMQDALVVLTDTAKVPRIAVYIRSGDSFTISGIVDGTYEVYFKFGNKWDGSSTNFVERGNQYRLGRPIDITTTWKSDRVEYNIWKLALEEAVPNANMAIGKVPVSEWEFPI